MGCSTCPKAVVSDAGKRNILFFVKFNSAGNNKSHPSVMIEGLQEVSLGKNFSCGPELKLCGPRTH